MVINKKIMRTMMESKAQYIGSLLLIIFSCLLYTMFNLLSNNMSTLTSNFTKNYVQEDASFVADRTLTDISALETKFNMKMEETSSVDYEVSEGKTLRIFSHNSKVNLPAIIEGNDLKGQEILIDPAFAKSNQLKIGDSVKLHDKEFKIAGFMSLPNYIYPLKEESDLLNDPERFGIAVISKEEFKQTFQGTSFYAVRFNRDNINVNDKIDELKSYLKEQNIVILKWLNTSENPRISSVEAKIKGYDKLSATLPIAIILLTCILTGVVIWRMLKREFVIIGTLYALGYRKREIMWHYLMYPLIIALLGGLIGTILGALTTRPMIGMMVTFFNMPVDVIDYNIKYLVISVLLPLIFLSISSYLVVNKALKYSPVELMRGGREKGKVGFIERSLKLDKLNFATKFKVREQLRSIPRSIFLLLGVVLATMLLLMGFTAKSSMSFLMRDTYENTLKYKYQYVFNSLQRGTPVKGEAFSEIPLTLKSDKQENFAAFGINPNTKLLELKSKTGKRLSTDKVIITRALADKLQVKPQDTIVVVNKLDAKEYKITVDDIGETYVGGYIYMPLSKFNHLFNLPADSYIGLWSKDKLSIPENQLFIALTISDIQKAFESMTAPLQAYVGVIAFISFIIGLIVIYVVTSMIIEENKQSISLMKVMGYRKREVYSLILNSSSFIIVIGYIIGVPLLITSMSALYKSVTKGMNFSLPVTIDYSYVAIGFVVIYLTYELSKALSKRKVDRIQMTEALKSGME